MYSNPCGKPAVRAELPVEMCAAGPRGIDESREPNLTDNLARLHHFAGCPRGFVHVRIDRPPGSAGVVDDDVDAESAVSPAVARPMHRERASRWREDRVPATTCADIDPAVKVVAIILAESARNHARRHVQRPADELKSGGSRCRFDGRRRTGIHHRAGDPGSTAGPTGSASEVPGLRMRWPGKTRLGLAIPFSSAMAATVVRHRAASAPSVSPGSMV